MIKKMRKQLILKSILISLLLFLTISMINVGGENISKRKREVIKYTLLYDNIWGAIYNAEKRQCDDTPLITGNNFKINPVRASEHRIIAISPEMLDSPFRVKLYNNPKSRLYKGKIKYGDTVLIDSPHPEINGFWVVQDTKSSKPQFMGSIDFLQTKGDGSLYNNNPLWSGKFENIKIYKVKNYGIINK